MATFSTFMDILPDPSNKINSAGAADAAGSAGPGFAEVTFRSQNDGNQTSRTRSGRGVTASPGSHTWMFDIKYNPLTRNEFDPVAAFLESRYGNRKPFYVILPQHSAPKDATFTGNTLTASATAAGSPSIMINGVSNGNPSVGDFFEISDSSDANHKKVYKVTRVETSTTYQTGTTAPTSTQRRLWTQPPMNRAVSSGATINFSNPKFRVIQSRDTFEYSLGTNNLYSYTLSLEEFLP